MIPRVPRSVKGSRSQSALEYMMTYGWAILIIVIVAGVLYSLGIFSPSSSIGTTITGFSGISVTAATANASIFEIQIINNAGYQATIDSIYLIDNGDNYSSFACTDYILNPTQSTDCEILKGGFGSRDTVTASITMLYSINNALNSVSVSQGRIILQSQAAGLSVSVKPDVYVANQNSNTVTAISGLQALYNVSTGANPVAIAYDPSNGYIYVANYNSGTVSIINGTALVATVSTGSQPDGCVYDPINGYVYVTNRYSNTTSIISGTTVIQNITGFAFPELPTYDPSNQYVYVGASGGSSLSIISGTSIIASAATLNNPTGMLLNPSNGDVYVPDWGSAAISEISGTRNVKNISSGLAILGGAYDVQDGLMYFGASSGDICIANTTTNLKCIAILGGNWGAYQVYDSKTGMVYSSTGQINGSSTLGRVHVLSGMNIIANLSGAFDFPRNPAYDSSTGYVYVPNGGLDYVSIISGTSVIRNVTTGSDPGYILAT